MEFDKYEKRKVYSSLIVKIFVFRRTIKITIIPEVMIVVG